MDLAYSIRRQISHCANDTKELEIIALDDLDERYSIRTKSSDGMWLNFLKSPLWVEKLCSPEKGVIEVTVRKDYPKYRGCEDEEKFSQAVAEYFSDLFYDSFVFRTRFRMTKQVTSADTSDVEYDSDGNPRWVDTEDYVGSTWTLDGPIYESQKGYTTFSKERKDFILRKMEAIFDQKGAICREIPQRKKDRIAAGDLFHYEFVIKNF